MVFLCKRNRVARTYLGGRRIDALRGDEPKDGFQPEEWVASVTYAHNAGSTDPNEGLSVCGERTLLDLLSENPSMLGRHEKLPILLKLLDASERLVIQVHPTVPFAKENWHSEFGKAECWYIISADEDACVYLGFKEGVTREAWERCFETQDVPTMLSMLHRIPLDEGDIWYVDGGVPHAIGGGCLMAELQEPTDLMVVPEKVTPSGRVIAEQRLHGGLGFEKMFDCFVYRGYSFDELKAKFHRHAEPEVNRAAHVIDRSLTDKFRMDEYLVSGSAEREASGEPGVAVVIGGRGTITDRDGTVAVRAGDGLFLPADCGALRFDGEFRILIAEP